MKFQRGWLAGCLLVSGCSAAHAGVLAQHASAVLLTVAVPEPGSLAFLCGGLLAVAGFGLRKPKK